MREPAIEVRGLSFSYAGDPRPVLRDLSWRVEPGSRCLLLGANGAGKTTLLGIVAGRYMVDEASVRVLGRSAFHDTSLSGRVVFLGGEFPFISDISVSEILKGGVGIDPVRQARLVEILEIDPAWRMHRVSAGQRRRVQLLMGLRRFSEVLFLDEITTDLDVIGRADLLAFLREESEGRGVTLVYATHILDGLEEWASHLAYLSQGQMRLFEQMEGLGELAALRREGVSSPLLKLVTRWLRQEQAL
jgi:CCR4-NOT complex subunit CAF16